MTLSFENGIIRYIKGKRSGACEKAISNTLYGKGTMKIQLLIDKKYKQPEIHICSDEKNQITDHLVRTIGQAVNLTLTGYEKNAAEILPCESLIRIYSQNKKVFAVSDTGTYQLRERLYELEKILDGSHFVRISNSEIINIRKIRRLDTDLAGTIRIYFKNETETYASRRYVSRIKNALGI